MIRDACDGIDVVIQRDAGRPDDQRTESRAVLV